MEIYILCVYFQTLGVNIILFFFHFDKKNALEDVIFNFLS